jgi:hypothetical protein
MSRGQFLLPTSIAAELQLEGVETLGVIPIPFALIPPTIQTESYREVLYREDIYEQQNFNQPLYEETLYYLRP